MAPPTTSVAAATSRASSWPTTRPAWSSGSRTATATPTTPTPRAASSTPRPRALLRQRRRLPADRRPWTFNHSRRLRQDRRPAPSTDDPYGYFNSPATRHPELLHWYPRWTAGTFTGQSQAGWIVTGNDDYVAYGGEFTAVNGDRQQGLVRFVGGRIAPNKIAPASAAARLNGQRFGVSVVSFEAARRASAGRRIRTATTRPHLQGVPRYQAITGPTMYVQTADTRFWEPADMGCVDTTVAPGSTHSYRSSPSTTSATRSQYQRRHGHDRSDGDQQSLRRSACRADSAAQLLAGSVRPTGRSCTTGSASTTPPPGAASPAAPPARSGDANTASTFNGTAGQGRGRQRPGRPEHLHRRGLDQDHHDQRRQDHRLRQRQHRATSSNYDRHVYMDNAGRSVFGVYPGGVQTLTTSAELQRRPVAPRRRRRSAERACGSTSTARSCGPATTSPPARPTPATGGSAATTSTAGRTSRAALLRRRHRRRRDLPDRAPRDQVAAHYTASGRTPTRAARRRPTPTARRSSTSTRTCTGGWARPAARRQGRRSERDPTAPTERRSCPGPGRRRSA